MLTFKGFFNLRDKVLNKNNLGECYNLLKLRILSINSVVSKHQFNELRNNKYTKVLKKIKKQFFLSI